MDWRKKVRKEGRKNTLQSKNCGVWIQEYSGMFLLGSLLSLWFPSAAGSLLTPGLLVWWMTLWHYFSPERHWGPGCPCPGYETFLRVCLYRKRRHNSLMNPQDHVEHAGLDPKRGVQNVPLDSGCVIKNLQLYKQKRYLQPLFQGSYFSPKHSSIRHNQKDKNNNNLPLLVLKI